MMLSAAKVCQFRGKTMLLVVLLATLLVMLSLSAWATEAQAVTGPDWSLIGTDISGSGVEATSIQTLNGTPYVAFSERNWMQGQSGNVGVMKYDGTSWSFVKSAGAGHNYITQDAADEVVMTIEGNVLYVAFNDTTTGHIVVMRYDTADPGAVWETIGTGNEMPAGLALSICAGGDRVFVTFQDTNWNGCVYLFDGTAWSGGIVSPESYNGYLPIVIVNGVPYMAYYNTNHYGSELAENTGGAWNTWTAAGNLNGPPLGMCANGGVIYVTCVDWNTHTNRVIATSFDTNNGNLPSPVGSFISNGSAIVSTTTFDNGALYVGFREADGKMYVKRFNGTGWEQVGSAMPYTLFSSICAENNKIYCAFGASSASPLYALMIESIDLTGYLIPVSVSATPAAGGTVTGAGTYITGNSATVTATANSGYLFVNWTVNGTQVSADASYTFNLGTTDTTLVANFTPITHTVSVSATPTDAGNVSGGGTYNEGAPVTVTATANSGYAFVNWTVNGTQVSADASYTFTLGTTDASLVANFGEDWDHIFEDIKQPTMKLYINTKRKTFQFVAPDKVFPVKTAPKMLVITKTITIYFKDRDLTINALATGGGVDSCIVTVKDVKTGKIYMLVDSIDSRRSIYR